MLRYAKSLQSCPTLCDPIDSSLPGSPIPGILQARTPEWVAISFPNAWKWKVKVKSLSRVQLSDPMDCSPPGSSVPGIFQVRVLEWGVIARALKKQGDAAAKLRTSGFSSFITPLKVVHKIILLIPLPLCHLYCRFMDVHNILA